MIPVAIVAATLSEMNAPTKFRTEASPIAVRGASARVEIEDTLQRCLADDTYAWTMGSDGGWTRRQGRTRSVHNELMERTLALAASSGS